MTPHRLLMVVSIISIILFVSVQGFSLSRSVSWKTKTTRRTQFHRPTLRSPSPTATTTPGSSTNAATQHYRYNHYSNQRHARRRTSLNILEATSSSTLFGREQRQQSSRVKTPTTTTVLKHQQQPSMSKFSAFLTKVGMIVFIVSMCLALPVALLPPVVAYRLGLISKTRKQQLALSGGQFCARWLLRLIPFCHVTTKIVRFCDDQQAASGDTSGGETPQPSIWVCNHTSALDVFILLAKDLELRGKGKRPIKVVYVSQQELYVGTSWRCAVGCKKMSLLSVCMPNPESDYHIHAAKAPIILTFLSSHLFSFPFFFLGIR
jgi:hypothetical protein